MGDVIQKIVNDAHKHQNTGFGPAVLAAAVELSRVSEAIMDWLNPPSPPAGAPYGGGGFGGGGATGSWGIVSGSPPSGLWCTTVCGTALYSFQGYFHRPGGDACQSPFCNTFADKPTSGAIRQVGSSVYGWFGSYGRSEFDPPGACNAYNWDQWVHYRRCPGVVAAPTPIATGPVVFQPPNAPPYQPSPGDPPPSTRPPVSEGGKPSEAPTDDDGPLAPLLLPIPLMFPPPIVVSVLPRTGAGPYVRPPRPQPRKPPRKGQKERKAQTRSARVAIAIFRALDAISEAAEVVDCAFENLPKDVQKKWSKGRPKRGLLDNAGQYGIDGADWKAQAVWHNSHKLDIQGMAKCLVRNHIQDQVLGAIHKRAGGRVGKTGPRIVPGRAIDPAMKEVNSWLDAVFEGVGLGE